MREILFRGKSKHGTHRDRNTDEWIGAGTWVEGFFVNCSSIFDDREKDRIPEIVEYMADRQFTGEYCWTDVHEVDPDTVSQWTGMTDKNGVKIFEGDIVSASWGYKGIVEFDSFIYAELESTISDDIEVVGNIWDNPELLEKKGEN